MSGPSLPEEQLLELLLQLKKTTADSARTILNSQPQISYALITLMVNMNAVNVDVLQKTVASFGSLPTPAPTPTPTSIPHSSVVSAPSIPQHLQPPSQYRISTPPAAPSTYAYPNGHSQPPSSAQAQTEANYGQTQPPAAQSSYGYQTSNFPSYPPYTAPPQVPAAVNSIPEALASIPDEQKAMIMRVISMTPEEINLLPPTERAGIIQLRVTLGLPC